MKKIKLILLSGLIIALFMYYERDNDILIGLHLLFSIIFILQGIMCANSSKDLFIGDTLSSIAFIIPVNVWFSMGSCIDLLIIYILIAIASFYAKGKIQFNSNYKY